MRNSHERKLRAKQRALEFRGPTREPVDEFSRREQTAGECSTPLKAIATLRFQNRAGDELVQDTNPSP